MFEIWETGAPGRRLGEADDWDAAVGELDAECERRYRQAAAAGGAGRCRFEIREDGQTAAVLSWAPDLTRPYESAVAALREYGEMP
ncbi:hypothetical protein [Actinomadura sp. WMMA1423]|uniref:hypothetical protein n=1 Tax=Actinomadura sp. WMMA1423 TaxID=2591108 RepID=UPI0011478E30|nr:hypothetical protein [Actinomadura sp. WMMA1423]